nr:thermophilic carboxylesterase [uncultured bacterium]
MTITTSERTRPMWQEHIAGRKIGLETGPRPFDPHKPCLLMVHGSGGRGETFRPQLSGLAPYLNPAAIDLPGHGNTPGPGRDQVAHYADWLAEFIRRGPLRPALLGHSLGGAIVMQLALDHPDLAPALVLVGTGSRLRVLPAILDGLLSDFDATLDLVLKYAYAPGADPRWVQAGREIMSQPGPRVVHDDFAACDRYDITDRLGEITAPTLLIYGDQDQLTPPKYGRFLAERLPDARLEIVAGAGHMVNLERHAEVNRLIPPFISAFSPPASS